ncbi:MAG: phospholipid/cholesterol/gamma-HCH transport system substrate-binding protein [Thermoleophilaceae bacterium]|jgi:virulence factor Mce-like protein|nr:phospholipid/cholesterol/gamma-HCH transport system substrate-binding protein [Thermoleophilaceae bacterium]
MAERGQKKPRRNGGMSPAKAGIIALVVIVILTFEGFTRFSPFKSPFELKATFHSVNNLQPKSPVRIAGVNVGAVTEVKPLGSGKGAQVTMEIQDVGLPIHTDAQMKIRPRIFLEGNFFVDVLPGSPSAPDVKSGDTIPVNQTSTPVQLGDLLTALQSDTRSDLKVLIDEYAVKGLGNGGAEAYNKSLDYATEAFRSSALANQATLGEQPHDLSNVLRGQQRLFAELASNTGTLKDLVTQLNVTFLAFARQDGALRATIPALRDTLRVGRPALASLDSALPALRNFSRDALPGVRSSGPTIDASFPFIRQVRLLVRPQELRGLVADLRPTIPALARLNRATIPFLNESRALSACQNNVLVPFSNTPIPDPDFPDNSGQLWYKQSARGLVGLAGESRLTDADSPTLHVQINGGSSTVLNTNDQGQGVFAAAGSPPAGVRPIRPNSRPVFRPNIPCELQEPPDLNAPGGGPDKSVTQTIPGGLLPPLPGGLGFPKVQAKSPTSPASSKLAKSTDPGIANLRAFPFDMKGLTFNQVINQAGQVQLNELKWYLARKRAGKPAPDPYNTTQEHFLSELKKLGLTADKNGNIVPLPKKKKAVK